MSAADDPAPPPPDAAPLRSAMADDPAFAPVLAPYVAGILTKRTELAAAAAKLPDDAGPLREFAHRLKGTAGGYGFPAVTRAAAAVVAACRDGRPDDARAAAAALDGLLARIG